MCMCGFVCVCVYVCVCTFEPVYADIQYLPPFSIFKSHAFPLMRHPSAVAKIIFPKIVLCLKCPSKADRFEDRIFFVLDTVWHTVATPFTVVYLKSNLVRPESPVIMAGRAL